MSSTTSIPEFPETNIKESGGIQINFKRVTDRAIRHWYFIVLSLLTATTIAYFVNRYSTRIYPVKASIIIRESEEDVGAKFLYNNELLSPYRNFYNEIFIMKSYPLLQGVVESLGFDVSFYREGEIKTTEYYDPNFPVRFMVLSDEKGLIGKSFNFKVINETTYSLQYVTEDDEKGKLFPSLHFGDSVKINGFRLHVVKVGDFNEIKGKTYVVKFNDMLAMAKSYSSRLKANWAIQGASVVDIEITGAIAQKEIDFLNRFIERYQQYDIEKKTKMASRAMGFLDQQLVVIGDSLEHFEDQVEGFKHRNVITNLEGETNRLYGKVQELEDSKFQYKLLNNYFTYIIQLLKNDQFDGIFTPNSVGINDNVITQLINELIQEQTQVNLYRSNISKGVDRSQDNPALQAKLQKIQYIKSDILKTIENSKRTQQINLNFINDQIKLTEQGLNKLPGRERELVDIKRNYSLRENLYIYLLQKRTEAGLSMASTTSDIVVVNPPMAGGSLSPKVMQNYIMGVSIGILLPLLIFTLLELINNRIQSKEDIERITSAPVIGGIGHNPETESLVVYNKPRSAMAESFRALRSNLNYFTDNKNNQVFMVTSSVPGEGKSFTTLNLATVFALAGKKTLMIGGDLRKPKLYSELSLNNNIGLSQYLSGMASLNDIVQTSLVENLFMIPGGPMPPNPSELILKPAMEQLMKDFRSQFDIIIIDTPPLTLVTDAFVLSKFADHVLFIVRQNFTPNTALRSLEEYYSTGKLNNVSILFNDLRKSGLGYGYEGYGYGYGYGYAYGYGKRRTKGTNGYYQED